MLKSFTQYILIKFEQGLGLGLDKPNPWVTGPICREFDALQDDVCTVDSTFIVMEIIGKM